MRVKQLLTAEDVWQMPEPPDGRYELVDGELVKVPGVGALHALIGGLVYELLRDAVRARDLGLVFGDSTAYIVRRDPDRLRIPDVSFIAWERVPDAGVPEGFWEVAPDLAVEIVSPHERVADTLARVEDYLTAGTRLVWVLWPGRQGVTVRAPGVLPRELGPEDELDGGDVLLGFRVRVAALFAVRRRR